MTRWVVVAAGCMGCVGVMIGAFGAHGLEEFLAERQLSEEEIHEKIDQCDVAVQYHLLHSLALLAVGLAPASAARRRKNFAALFLLLGILLFSGGLYSMVFLGVMGHWAIVPAGGLCFIIGWVGVASLGLSKRVDD